MEYDIHNQRLKAKGRFTHSFTHKCGAGFVMKHERGIVQVAIDCIAKMGVDMIIELGTFRGGFTKLLEDKLPYVPIHTFDTYNGTVGTKKFFGKNVHFYKESVLTKCPPLLDLLAMPEKKLLYCDNGRKRQEVAMYAPLLGQGDYIGVHDWGNEIWWKDVKDYVGGWERFGWGELEAVGQTSRFWRRPHE